MLRGILFALGACFIWGLIFVVPQFMENFTSLEVALGRYFFYGAISSLILIRGRVYGLFKHPPKMWMRATYFSLAASIGYYPFVVLALRYATPAVCALILGISPITSAFYGNWKQKERSYKSLIFPSILILIGLIIINVPQFGKSESPLSYAFGLFCALWALLSWSWYVVANSAFLKRHPEMSPGDWSTLLGVMSLAWVVVLSIGIIFFFKETISLEKYVTMNPALTRFLLGCAVLGLICSWIGAFLWNRASLYLPISLAGQLTIFETIFGLIFVYIIDLHLPPAREFLGIAFLLAAIIYGIRISYKINNEEKIPS